MARNSSGSGSQGRGRFSSSDDLSEKKSTGDSPFAALAELLSGQRASAATPEAASRKAKAAAGSRAKEASARSSSYLENNDEGDEAALFFDAVRRIKPLASQKERSANGRPLGDVLAARMKENSGPATSRVPGSAAGSTPGSTPGVTTGASAGVPPAGKKHVSAKAALHAEETAAAHAFIQQAEGCLPLRGAGGRSFAGMRSAGKSGIAPAPEGRAAAMPSAETAEREEDTLFMQAVKGVMPVGGKGRALAPPVVPAQGAAAADPGRALRDVLEGRVEFCLHNTDEYMEGAVVGIDPAVLERLKSGTYSPEKHLDLHGMNGRQAYDALVWFIKEAYQRGLRTLVVVTGRGKNSPDGMGVLRPLLSQWLCREPFKRVVLAFCTAKPHDGGPGAVYVLLRKYKKNRGKIMWDVAQADSDMPDV